MLVRIIRFSENKGWFGYILMGHRIFCQIKTLNIIFFS